MSERTVKRFTETQERFGKRLLKYFSRAHVFFYRLSGGIIGGTAVGLPIALLTTIGRVSGQPRTTPVNFTTGDNDEVYLLASQTGMSKHPQWYRNMSAHPEVQVQIRRQKMEMLARQANAEERPALFAKFSSTYEGFDDYEKRTSGIREIPVMILERRG